MHWLKDALFIEFLKSTTLYHIFFPEARCNSDTNFFKCSKFLSLLAKYAV